MCGEWRETTLGEAVEINPPRRAIRGSLLPHVAMDDLSVNSRDVASTSAKPFVGSGARFQNDDTLLARITPCLENGKTAFVQSLDTDAVGHGSTEFIVMSGKPGVTDSLYVYYVARSSAFREYAIQKMEGSSGRQRVPTDAVARYRVNLPPLEEQRAIAAVLGALDDKIELNRRMNGTLEAMARALFKSWFVDFDPVRANMEGRTPYGMDTATAALFPAAFTDSPLGPIPAGWHVSTIAEVAELNGWTLGKWDALDRIEYIEISEVMRGDIHQVSSFERGNEPGRARRRLRHGDTVLSTVRPDRGAYFLSLHPSINVIASTGFTTVTPVAAPWSFVHAALTQPLLFEHLGRLADGAAYPAVAPEVIGTWEIPIPDATGVLTRFQAICEPLHERAHCNREESSTLATIRDALLPKLLSGAVRIRDAMRAAETTSLVRREMVTHE